MLPSSTSLLFTPQDESRMSPLVQQLSCNPVLLSTTIVTLIKFTSCYRASTTNLKNSKKVHPAWATSNVQTSFFSISPTIRDNFNFNSKGTTISPFPLLCLSCFQLFKLTRNKKLKLPFCWWQFRPQVQDLTPGAFQSAMWRFPSSFAIKVPIVSLEQDENVFPAVRAWTNFLKMTTIHSRHYQKLVQRKKKKSSVGNFLSSNDNWSPCLIRCDLINCD